VSTDDTILLVDTVIRVEHLQKHYRKFEAVKDISFEVSEGEIFGLLGPNGAGKTTTVECLQGLRHYDGGSAHVLGFDPNTQASLLRRSIGSQLQESALPDRMKVWEALDLFASLSRVKHSWVEIMDQWELSEKRNASFASLSGGQRQRLFVALALVNRPRLVFLDEMTTGLDPAARHVAWDLVRAIRAQGATVVLVTHFMDEATALCDRLAIVDGGLIVAEGTPQSLIASYEGNLKVVFSTDEADLSFLEALGCVSRIERTGLKVAVYGTRPVLAMVAFHLVEHGIVPHDLWVEEPSLEDVFLKITGRKVSGE
jgi:ABC-2 type transport system ATP-binding protein